MTIYKDVKYETDVNRRRKNGKTRSKKVIFWPAELKSTAKTPKLSNEHTGFRWVNKDEASIMFDRDGAYTEMYNQFDNEIRSRLFTQ